MHNFDFNDLQPFLKILFCLHLGDKYGKYFIFFVMHFIAAIRACFGLCCYFCP